MPSHATSWGRKIPETDCAIANAPAAASDPAATASAVVPNVDRRTVILTSSKYHGGAAGVKATRVASALLHAGPCVAEVVGREADAALLARRPVPLDQAPARQPR